MSNFYVEENHKMQSYASYIYIPSFFCEHKKERRFLLMFAEELQTSMEQ